MRKSISIAEIIRFEGQPRTEMESEENTIADLAESIRERGLMHPILVRRIVRNGTALYQIIAGERRWLAHKLLKRSMIDCTIVQCGDDEEAFLKALIDNVRKELTPQEQARSVRKVWEMEKYRHLEKTERSRKIAAVFGKSDSWVSSRVALAELPVEIQREFGKDRLPVSAAPIAASIPKEKRREIIETIARSNVRASEKTHALRKRAADFSPKFFAGRHPVPERQIDTSTADAMRVVEVVFEIEEVTRRLTALDAKRVLGALKKRPPELYRAINVCSEAKDALSSILDGLVELKRLLSEEKN